MDIWAKEVSRTSSDAGRVGYVRVGGKVECSRKIPGEWKGEEDIIHVKRVFLLVMIMHANV